MNQSDLKESLSSLYRFERGVSVIWRLSRTIIKYSKTDPRYDGRSRSAFKSGGHARSSALHFRSNLSRPDKSRWCPPCLHGCTEMRRTGGKRKKNVKRERERERERASVQGWRGALSVARRENRRRRRPEKFPAAEINRKRIYLWRSGAELKRSDITGK